MKTDRLPPRERGLKPTHYIEAYSNGKIYSASHKHYACINSYAAQIGSLDRQVKFTNTLSHMHTIAIFKIYPKHK